jgi:hypothetical protein
MTFGTWKWGRQPHAPAAFTPRIYSWYSFSLGAESTPGPWYSQKEYVTEKSSDITGNRSRDRPTSSTASSPLRHYCTIVMYYSRIHWLRFRERQRNILFNDAISCEDYTVSVVKEWNMSLRNLIKYSDREILSRTMRETCPAAILSAVISTDPVDRGELF